MFLHLLGTCLLTVIGTYSEVVHISTVGSSHCSFTWRGCVALNHGLSRLTWFLCSSGAGSPVLEKYSALRTLMTWFNPLSRSISNFKWNLLSHVSFLVITFFWNQICIVLTFWIYHRLLFGLFIGWELPSWDPCHQVGPYDGLVHYVLGPKHFEPGCRLSYLGCLGWPSFSQVQLSLDLLCNIFSVPFCFLQLPSKGL